MSTPTTRHPRMLSRRIGPFALAALLVTLSHAQPADAPPASDPPSITPPAAPASTPESETPDREPEANVLLRDGQRYTGFIVDQNDDRVLLRISGIATSIPRSQIEVLQTLPPVMTRFRQMREAIDDDDADSLVKLCEWVRARGRPDVALIELERLLQKNPTHVEARRLKILILSQKELDKASKKIAETSPRNTTPSQAPAEHTHDRTPRSVRDIPLLNESQINLIKVYEIDLKSSPRLIIDRDTITRLIEEHVGDPLIPTTPEGREALYTAPPTQLLDVMFRIQARNLYERVRVIDHPRSMDLFRDAVHRTMIQNACATTKCHGGSEAGRLQFATRSPNSDTTLYTNFLILDRTRTIDGKPLLDYDQPARSIFLQMALPRDRSVNPHPPVPNAQGKSDLWKPYYRSVDDERFIRAIDWLNALYRPRPKYPIEYTPPGMQPKPQPLPPADPADPPVQR